MMATNHTHPDLTKLRNQDANNSFWPGAIVLNFADGKVTKNTLLELEAFNLAVDIAYCDFGIQIAINKDVPKVLVLNHFSASSIKIKLAPRVCAKVLHYFGSDSKINSNTSEALTLDLGHSATLSYYLFFSSKISACHSLDVKAQINTNAELNFFDLSLLKEGEIKSNYAIDLSGNEARLNYYALSKLSESARYNSTLEVLHKSPNTVSAQTFRGIYGQKASGSFLGKVLVDKIAHESSARQHYQAILLSPDAKAYVMPQLEVNNSDISASHGASIGELDADALFYLRSRGICEGEAKAMMLTSLTSEIIEAIDEAKIQCFINRHVDDAIKNSIGADL